MAKYLFHTFALIISLHANHANADIQVLYQNDFESPNQTPVVTCGRNLDKTSINTMYGTPSNQFGQRHTVETVLVKSYWDYPATTKPYVDDSDNHGNYAIGILAERIDDLLWLDFQVDPSMDYFVLEIDISAIDVNGCGAPANTNLDPPQFHLTLKNPSDLSLIDEHTITGMSPDNQWTYNWTHHVITFNKGSEQNVRVALDSQGAEYSVFDNLYIYTSTTDPNVSGNPNISGDPHITTWSGAMYDFHGACDLVMLQNPSFRGGIGMDIHIRTKSMLHQWSYISSAVLRIGDDTLEVMGGKQRQYWINGVAGESLEHGIAGHPIRFTQVNSKSRMFVVDLNDSGESIVFKTWKNFVRVELVSPSEESYRDSLGLMGSFRYGHKIGRDKVTVFEDTNEFGLEWQVLPDEPMFFHKMEGVQAPAKCAMPDYSMKLNSRRRLGERTLSLQDAEMVCASIHGLEHDACVFDVLATNDKEMVEAY